MRLIQYTYPTHRRYVPAFSRTPWTGLESEIDRLFDSVLRAPAVRGAFPVDLYADKDNTYVRAELPGVNRDAIQVEVVDGDLKIQATFKTGQGDNPEQSTFTRTVALADDVQTDKVAATYENGVLTVTLPRKEEAQPKKVTVQVNQGQA